LAGYLASSGCESSVFAMIEDMPFLKFYVPKQPLGMSKSEYMKLLGRPSFTPGLEDVLNDYGRSKNLGLFVFLFVVSLFKACGGNV
jgi:hypothetical protein